MACLNYEPSAVEFERNLYVRSDLIKAKGDLLSYCLGQLKHLDLSLLDHKMHVAALDSRPRESGPDQDRDMSIFDPKDFPPVPSSMAKSQSREVDWLQQDSVQSIQTGRRFNEYSNGHSHKKHSLYGGLATVRLSMPNPAKDITSAQTSRHTISKHQPGMPLASPVGSPLATIGGSYRDDVRLDVRYQETSTEQLDTLSIDGTGMYDA